jgi:hypothetical protein
MSTTTAARSFTRLTNDGNKPVINHYNHKEDITRAIVTGESILALCGFIGPIRAQGNGSVAKRTRGVYIICEDCKRIYAGLPHF